MKVFEFVLIILSLIVGLSLTEGAVAVSYMIQNYKIANMYFPFVVLTAVGFLSILNYYTTLFKLQKVVRWNVYKIGLVFSTGLVFFVTTQIFFPDQEGFDHNYKRYYHEIIGIVFSLLTVFVILYMIELYYIRGKRGWKLHLYHVGYFLIVVSGALIDNHSYQAALPFLLLSAQLYLIYSSRIILVDEKM